MNIHKIVLPTPYRIGDVNAFLVKGEALTLFDVGPKTQETYEALQWGIRSAGYTMKDIEQVILTHHHPDHTGWVDAFPNAQILGHEYVNHWLRQTPEFLQYREQFYRKHLLLGGVPLQYIDKIYAIPGEMKLYGTLPLTQYLNEGDEVPGHPGLFTYYVPGHAQSHLLFIDKKTNTAIGGDLLLEKVSSNPLVEPPVDLSMKRPKYLLQYHKSLKKLKQFHLSKLYTGHGNEIINVNELVDSRLKRDHQRSLQVLEFLSEPKTLLEVTKFNYQPVYKTQLGLTLSKTMGYLDYLENEGLLTIEQVDDVHLFQKSVNL